MGQAKLGCPGQKVRRRRPEVKPFKGRKVDFCKKVHVYRNLNGTRSTRWSIRQGGLVVGHADELEIEDATFHVSRAGWLRMVKSGSRNVHAYAAGFLEKSPPPFWSRDYRSRIVYDRENGLFKNTNVTGIWAGTTITSALRVHFSDAVYAEFPNYKEQITMKTLETDPLGRSLPAKAGRSEAGKTEGKR
mgnify:CR=1 FL=1